MQPLECSTCSTRVMVEKFSWHHTSVQWLADSETSCAQFRVDAVPGRQGVHIRNCSALRETIRQAVLDGTIPIPPD